MERDVPYDFELFGVYLEGGAMHVAGNADKLTPRGKAEFAIFNMIAHGSTDEYEGHLNGVKFRIVREVPRVA